jgi:anti-sigma factor RsiW
VQHISEDSLEQYAMGAFPEPEAGPLEEHLLICTACQDRLQATDDYVAAMRAAAKVTGKAAKRKTAVKKAAAPAPAVRRASGE